MQQKSSLDYEQRVKYFHDDNPYSEPPDVFELFRYYNEFFFNDKLNSSFVRWSNRMTLCAGTCKYEGMGSCTITLSEPLLKFRSNNELKETLLHEMIHAYLFVTDPASCKVENGHGPKFKELMLFINEITGLKITVYHQFHDEVDRCRQHVWQCDGPCKDRYPYYGLVKRSMNRAPGPTDYWFKDHEKNCGGKYHKISEPEKVVQKRKAEKKPNNTIAKQDKQKAGKTLEEWFKEIEKQQAEQQTL